MKNEIKPIKMKLFLVLFSIVLMACDSASVDLSDENYLFDGRGGVKCDINGVELKPKITYSPGPGTRDLNYDYYNGEDVLRLSFYNTDSNDRFLSVDIIIKNFNPISTNLTDLKIDLDDVSQGKLYVNNNFEYTTDREFTGQFEIIYHDQSERILAGKFWYDAVNSDGEAIEIRNGEFDMKY